MTALRALIIGSVGTIITALCCFTPILVVVFGAMGLSAWLGWIDLFLLPALGVFVIITVVALARLLRERHATTHE